VNKRFTGILQALFLLDKINAGDSLNVVSKNIFTSRAYESHRLLYLAIIDGITILLCAFFSLAVRFDFSIDPRLSNDTVVAIVISAILCRISVLHILKANRHSWQHISLIDVPPLLKAHVAGSLLIGFCVFLLRPVYFPRSFVFIEFFASLVGLITVRVTVRALCEYFRSLNRSQGFEFRKKALVIGAGTTGHHVVKMLKSYNSVGLEPIFVLDDNQHLHQTMVHNVRVIGSIAELGLILAKNTFIDTVLVAIPSLCRERLQFIQGIAESFEVSVRFLQSLEEIACQIDSELNVQESVENFLTNQSNGDYVPELNREIENKRILITGAGGSIGSELVRQILNFNPAKLIMLDQSEYNLFNLQQELSNSEVLNENCQYIFVLCDITNQSRLSRVFKEHSPEVVFHAAAYKHVPLVEVNCYEGFLTNVVGTKNLLDLSDQNGVERFVLISTDKAVDPSSVMGASKRIAELMVRAYGDGLRPNRALRVVNSNNEENQSEYNLNFKNRSLESRMLTAAVRFGNVINSSGSVIPTFKKQILEGKEITVTHPEMERYFMSIKQAVRLVVTAGCLGKHGEVYLLDMGTPVKIVDIARKLRALYGRSDIPIKFVGLRPGEKMHECLIGAFEYIEPSQFKGVSVVRSSSNGLKDVFSWVDSMMDKIELCENEYIGESLKVYAKASYGNSSISTEINDSNEDKILNNLDINFSQTLGVRIAG
jgi:FlaA1/EpsC-like NDP-sugar epimerase